MPSMSSELSCFAYATGVHGSCSWLAVLVAYVWQPTAVSADVVRAPVAQPLVVEFEYADVRQEILVPEQSDFHVITHTKRGQLRASGRVGRVTEGKVELALTVYFDSRERGNRGTSLRQNLRLGEFASGMGTVPMAYILRYVWVRRGIDPVPTLREAIGRRDRNSAVAARHVGGLGVAARGAVADLVEVLQLAGSAELGEAAAVALGHIGPVVKDAVPVLTDSLANTQSGELRVAAAAALWKICRHPKATPTLIAALGESEKKVRLKALNALGEMSVEAPTAGPALRAALNDEDPQLRAAAAAALWATTRDTVAIDALMVMLENGDSGRTHAIEALGSIGYPDAHRATNEVATEAFSSHLWHRRSVANALKRIDPDGSQCAGELARILRFVEGDGAKEASEVMAEYGSTLLPRLRELLNSDNQYDRQLAVRTLWRIGTPGVGTLAESLRHDNVEVRRLAGSWLRALDAKAAAAIPNLIHALDDDNKEVRTNASHALSHIGPPAVPAVERLLDDRNLHIRKLAKQILSDIEAWEKMQGRDD